MSPIAHPTVTPFLLTDKRARIFVAGHRGMVGSAIVRALQARGYTNLILRTREELDLLDHASVEVFFAAERPEYVVLAAAKVGGIIANSTYPADFIRENLFVQTNIIDAAHRHGARRLLFLGSSCIYPREAPQPIKEEYLLTGPLEPTNEAYAIAKIAGLKMCEYYRQQYGADFFTVMPTNLYGPGDNYHPENSHVVPGMIVRFHVAKVEDAPEVRVWGTGNPRRELLHVNDMADACVFLLESYDGSAPVNIGTGEDIPIKELAELVSETVGYQGVIAFDTDRPDGMYRKQLDTTRLSSLGWKPSIGLRKGLKDAYAWYLANH